MRKAILLLAVFLVGRRYRLKPNKFAAIILSRALPTFMSRSALPTARLVLPAIRPCWRGTYRKVRGTA